MKKIAISLVIIVSFISCGSQKQETANTVEETTVKVYLPTQLRQSLSYPLDRLEAIINRYGGALLLTSNSGEKVALSLSLSTPNANSFEEVNDGYRLTKTSQNYVLEAQHIRGLIYGLLDITEQIDDGVALDELEQTKIAAHYPFRAIKFNLPWYSYRSGENLSLHMQTAQDLNYWQSFLDMMVENKFNTLTLWNLHPYMFMVASDKFPKANHFSDDEMAQWQAFWKSLFKMAKDRGVDTYVINWNIFVSEEFSKEYNTAKYASSGGFWGEGETSPLIEEYTREMVSKTIDEYEDLTGIGLTLGERMGGMTSQERKEWADRTIIAGLKAAKRRARLIYRAPLSAGKSSKGATSETTEKLTRDALETMDLNENIWVEFKFNWSHAHSSPKVSIVHGGMLTDTYWEPLSNKYKGLWTMRNEDFFVMRWAQPDFIRDFIKYNSQPYVGGAIIGSEVYIPAKDYITKPEYRSWDYAFERQWLFYKVWGNLLFNPATTDSGFADALADKFALEDGGDLLKAWKLASMNANRFATFYQGEWDATLYTEGFTTVGGKLIDINKLISHPVLDKGYVNISDFVQGKYAESQISPLQLADITEQESQQALKLIAAYRTKGVSQELEIELTDIEFWANYGFYFANKARAGVALERFRNGLDSKGQNQAVALLSECLTYWKTMVNLAEKYNVAVVPYQFDQTFSWRKHIASVEKDIQIAKTSVSQEAIK